MASGEHQGLHIALIIFVILFLVLLVSTFFSFNAYQEADGRARKDAAEAAVKEAQWKVGVEEAMKLREIIGFKTDSKIEEDETAFKEDMDKLGAAFPADKRHYKPLLALAVDSISAVKAELSKAQADVAQLKEVNTAYEASAKKQFEEAITAKDAAVAELASEKQKFMEAQKKSDVEKKDLLEQVAKAQQASAAELEKAKKELEVVQKALATADTRATGVAEENKVLRGSPSYATDDGEIRSVNQRTKTAWVNLGSLDGLRRQVTFVVHAAGTPIGETTKGKIEIIQVLGEHLSEARILEDQADNPLIPGDKIYTPLWSPGNPEHFAIAGRIIFGGGGQDDHARLRSLIAINGGILDAEADPEDNKTTGRITAQTRYLIQGPIGSEKSREAYNGMVNAAKQYGVEVLGVDKFLDHIGWHDTTHVVRFGRDSNVEKLPPEVPDGGIPHSTGSTSEIFQKRRPGTTSSAY